VNVTVRVARCSCDVEFMLHVNNKIQSHLLFMKQ
jgi:hypothetical protein